MHKVPPSACIASCPRHFAAATCASKTGAAGVRSSIEQTYLTRACFRGATARGGRALFGWLADFFAGQLCNRLEKYAGRGFAIAVPGYEEASLSRSLLASTYFLIDRYGILLRVHESPATPANAVMSVAHADAKTLNLQYSRAVRTTAVKHLARLVILSRGSFERLSHPSEQALCATGPEPSVPEGGANVAVPVPGHLPDEYFLLYGAKHAATPLQTSSQSTSAGGEGDDDGDDDDDDYESEAEDDHEYYSKARCSVPSLLLPYLSRFAQARLAGCKCRERERCLSQSCTRSWSNSFEAISGCVRSLQMDGLTVVR